MTRKVKVKGKDIEVFSADDGHIEVYETEDPAYTGFIFSSNKQFNMFINYMTDIADELNMEENDE